MAASSTAQVVFKGNTADLQKKLKVAEKGMQEFKDMGSDALSSIGDLFGVNTGKIGDMLGSVKKLSAGFQAMGSTGGAAFAGLSKGAATLAGGVAAIGIAGLVAGFKELNRQADLFSQTDVGAAFVNVNKAWRDTYSMATMDAGQGGGAWLKFKEDFKNAGAQMGAIFGNSFAGVMQGQGFGESIRNALDTHTKARQQAMNAIPYATELEKAQRYMRDQSMVWAQQSAQIKAYERIARDTSKSEKERNDAIIAAKELTIQKDNDRTEALKRVYEAQKALNEQTTTTAAGIQDQVDKFNEWQNSIEQSESNLSSLERVENRINKSGGGGGVSSTAKAVDHLGEAIKSLHSSVEGAVNVNKVFGDSQDELKVSADAYKSALEGIVSTYGTEDERVKGLIDEYQKLAKARDDAANAMTRIETPTALASITPVATKKGVAGQMEGIAGWKMPELTSEQKQYYEFLQGMVDATERANEAISDALVNGISNSIQYLADALWGLEEFDGSRVFAALLTPLAEACVQMGELIMAQGLASKAFQESLSNPYAAIAAGAALIAVGALVKAGLNSAIKSVSGGGYSTSVASSAYTSTASNPSSFGREMEVKVTGTLTANGSQLVAVLNNEHNRNSYTT